MLYIGFKGISAGNLCKFMLVPQAWTLGIEEAFYLLSPWYIRLHWGSLLLLLFSGMAFMAVSDSFPLACLALFSGGILAHRLGAKLGPETLKKFGAPLSLLLALVVVTAPAWAPASSLKHFLLLGTLVLALPFVFSFFEERRWDRRLGEYSYPIYVGHFLAIALATYPAHWKGNTQDKLMLLGLTILVTLALRHGVEKPLEPLRRRLREGQWPWGSRQMAAVEVEAGPN
jgi:peptidoglycan/LPS O-acetylase OafA/YrhL